MTTQLTLSGFVLEDTPATADHLRTGEGGRVTQCSRCGVIAAVPMGSPTLVGPDSPMRHTDLAGCPRCGCDSWWDQELPVSVVRRRATTGAVTSSRLCLQDREVAGTWLAEGLLPDDELTRLHAVKVVGLLVAEVGELYGIIDRLAGAVPS